MARATHSEPPRRSPRSLIGLLWLTAGGVLAQATLAGLFLSGVAQARLIHIIGGWLLPYFAIAVAVVAGLSHARGSCPPRHAIAIYPLPVLLWIQEVLGHIPAAATTAVHVPLGVTLAIYPVVLALLIRTAPSAEPSRQEAQG